MEKLLSQSRCAIAMRRLRARRREEARLARREFLAARRAAKGLPPILSSTERSRRTRERQAAKRQAYLQGNWWSPELPELEAKAELRRQYPNRTELEIHTDYITLAAQCRGAELNVNLATIGTDGIDGVQRSAEQRAIFDHIQFSKMGNTADYLAVLKVAEVTPAADLKSLVAYGDLTNEGWLKNLVVKAIDGARSRWGNGNQTYQAVLEAKPVLKSRVGKTLHRNQMPG